jgi:hypothetical protein
MNAKKNLNDIKEFFASYAKALAPLLIDCWIEAKPEDRSSTLIRKN